ncbi:hypothetical protein [Providencia rettgeri]
MIPSLTVSSPVPLSPHCRPDIVTARTWKIIIFTTTCTAPNFSAAN